MNQIKRFSKKDKYGILRGCLLQCLLLVLLAALLLYAQQSRVSLSCARDTLSAAQRISVQLEQCIDDTMQHLVQIADRLDAGETDLEEEFQILAATHQVQDVRIEPADGILSQLVPMPQGGLQLRTALRSGEELTAVLSDDILHAIMGGTLEWDYDYTLYNTSTGACLFTSGDLNAHSFYDVLLNLSANGRVKEYEAAADESERVLRADMSDGQRYIAVVENEQKSRGVAIAVPASMLTAEYSSLLPALLYVLLPVLLLMGCAAASALAATRRIRNSNRNIARALDMSERQVSIAARDARITILVIGYGHEGILACHDGLGLTTAGNQLRSVSDLERVCGLVDGELDRVYECMNQYTDDRASVVTVRCHTAGNEERSLRISFRAAEMDGRNIICSISDCTHELAAQKRSEQERSYFANVKHRTSAVWQVNVSRNRWRALQISQSDPLYELMHSSTQWRDYSSDMGGVISDFIHPADYFDFAERLSIPSLAAAFRSGMTEMTMEHRIGAPRAKEYAWHRLHARLWTEPKTKDIIASFYLYNVDAKKNAELERNEHNRVLQQALKALSGVYAGLYYVDLDNDLCYTAKALDGDLSDSLCMAYNKTISNYIEANVHPEDRDQLRSMLSVYALKRSMVEGSHFQKCRYRRAVGDGSYSGISITIQPARFENGTIKEVVLAMRDLGSEE